MKKRLISAAAGLALLFIVVLLHDTVVLNIVLVLLGGLAIFEGLRAFGMEKKAALIFPLILVHGMCMFLIVPPEALILLWFFIVFFVLMTDKEQRHSFSEGSGVLILIVMITLGLSSVLRLRDLSHLRSDRIFMFILTVSLGWVCDTFAFFFGKLFGKRKMSPHISPKKTIAGAVGGVIGTASTVLVASYYYSAGAVKQSIFSGNTQLSHLLFFLVLGIVGASIAVFGDLLASFIKRARRIKDFGTIMPGHGGVLDRLDSVLFASIFALFMFQQYVNLFVLGNSIVN